MSTKHRMLVVLTMVGALFLSAAHGGGFVLIPGCPYVWPYPFYKPTPPGFVWFYFGTPDVDTFDPNLSLESWVNPYAIPGCPTESVDRVVEDLLPIMPEHDAFVFQKGTLSAEDTVVGLTCDTATGLGALLGASEFWLVDPGVVTAEQFEGVSGIHKLVLHSTGSAEVHIPGHAIKWDCGRSAPLTILSDGGGNHTIVVEGNNGDLDDYIVHGGDGAEKFVTSTGSDWIEGAGGDDVLNGKAGDDTIYGGEGVDILDGGDGIDIIEGNAGNDVAYGGGGIDTIEGGDGDDRLYGQSGSDVINGDAGNDYLSGGEGADVLNGGPGNDDLRGDAGGDTLTGGSGSDEMHGGAGRDELDGGDGYDKLFGDEGIDILLGRNGNDELRGGGAADELRGGEGNDKLFGDGNDDSLSGGEGNDELDGGDGTDVVRGGSGNDVMIAGAGGDELLGGFGDDTYNVSDPRARVIELDDHGFDQINTTLARYELPESVESLSYTGSNAFTGTGNDLDNVVTGGEGNDDLRGRAGNDWLLGGDGTDRLVGGLGSDVLHGGKDNDVFVVQPDSGHDHIYDWNAGDRIDASQLGLTWPEVYETVDVRLVGDANNPSAVEFHFSAGPIVTLHGPEEPLGVTHLDILL